jgi:hypothetical protein
MADLLGDEMGWYAGAAGVDRLGADRGRAVVG